MHKKANKVVRHSLDFALLLGMISICLVGILYFSFDRASQIAITILLSFMYVFWGVYHHYHDGDLTGKVVWEYIAMAALVGTALSMVLLRV